LNSSHRDFGGKSKYWQCGSVLDAMQKGHRAEDFAWTPPTVRKDMARTAERPGAGKAFTEHVANALAFDYGPEVGGFIRHDHSPGSELENNIAHERAMLSGDSEGHGVASALGRDWRHRGGRNSMLGAGELAALGAKARATRSSTAAKPLTLRGQRQRARPMARARRDRAPR
jgi:hypothetical protein